MTSRELYEDFTTLPNGGLLTAETRLQEGLVYQLIHACKNQAQQLKFRETKKTNPAWFVPYYPTYESTWQDNDYCYKRFNIEVGYTQFDGITDGLGYIGSTAGNKTFTPITNRVKWNDMQQHPLLRPRGDDVMILLEGNIAEVYGKPVREFKMLIVPTNPFDIPTFNIDIDPYPIDGSLLQLMKKLATDPDLSFFVKTKADFKQNAKDETAVNAAP